MDSNLALIVIRAVAVPMVITIRATTVGAISTKTQTKAGDIGHAVVGEVVRCCERVLSSVEGLVLGGVIAGAVDRHEGLEVVFGARDQSGEGSREAATGPAGGGSGGLVQVAGSGSVLEPRRCGCRRCSGEGARQGCPCRAHSARSVGGGY